MVCPNAALEALSCKPPTSAKDSAALPELKPWFAREFSDEVIAVLAQRDEAAAEEEGESEPSEKRDRGRRERS